MKMSRRAYAEMFGPTVGDRVRLADTELFIEVEQDLTTYGEEVKFGGGKVIRDGMGQSQLLADEIGGVLSKPMLVLKMAESGKLVKLVILTFSQILPFH